MTAPAQNAPAILSAIWSVMKSVTSVAKGGQYNEGGTRYKFRSIDDLLRDLGGAFREYGVFVQNEQLEFQTDRDRTTKSGVPWTTVRVKIRYRFTSLADGSELTFEAWGEGADTSDKATMKAHTMALKAALGQAFALPIDERDPDAERPEDFSTPVGRGQQFDPNQAARDRQEAERQQAAQQGVQGPAMVGSREEKVAAHVTWVKQEIANPDLDLERLAHIHVVTKSRQLLGVDAGGVPLETRIKAEMARWGIDPNATMPTPEQAKAWMASQAQGDGDH